MSIESGCGIEDVKNLSHFDAYEVHPCCEVMPTLKDGKITRVVETCEPEQADFWSVYGHFPTGGVISLADCPTEAVAKMLANALEYVQNQTQDDKCPSCFMDNKNQKVHVDDLGAHVVCPVCGLSHNLIY